MGILKFFFWLIAFAFLTLISQVGGLILLGCIPIFGILDKKYPRRRLAFITNSGVFLATYLIMSSLLVPLFATMGGRVPLPITGTSQLKPLNYMTCFLNRHYVTKELKATLIEAARQMDDSYPGTVIAYLDAGFPFFDNFPLLPHLSHDDGQKADIAFLYQDRTTGKDLHRKAPSFIGYGVFEGPEKGEPDFPKQCSSKGYWQYSFMERLVPQGKKERMKLDVTRTKALVNILARQNNISKIFLEPHLKERMKLNSSKIRYHGCHSVRHDDHIHIQL